MDYGNKSGNKTNKPGKILPGLVWRVLSTPIFLKIMGIGFLVAILFGSVTLIQTRVGTARVLSQLIEQKVLASARILAHTIEEPARNGDSESTLKHLQQAQTFYPEMLYAIVRYPDGRIMVSTNEKDIPPDFLNNRPPPSPSEGWLRLIGEGDGTIYEARVPILDGEAGMIQVGFMGDTVSGGLQTFTGTVLWGLLLCIVIGALLALLLTNILTRPIRHLVESANRIREGRFETRAEVYSDDEIGRLATAFNQMAEALNKYQKEVQAKEKARISLIERIVQVQEDERKSISRELHDQLGQSLLALLLQVQSFRSQENPSGSVAASVEKSIRQAIDEVHSLAWGMRPSILDDYGLDSALARHIDEISRHIDLKIDYSYSSPPNLERLPGRIEVCLYRIAQEALTNIQRHAGASRASVVVLRQVQEITLLIEDNGRGFNLSMLDEKRDKCLGLIGMRERVELLGGSVVIESVPGEGTTIRVKIPLDGGPDVHTNIDSR